LADGEAAFAGDPPRAAHRPRPAGAGRGDRHQRRPGVPTVSRRPRPALRPG
jgi:hypothetical protein